PPPASDRAHVPARMRQVTVQQRQILTVAELADHVQAGGDDFVQVRLVQDLPHGRQRGGVVTYRKERNEPGPVRLGSLQQGARERLGYPLRTDVLEDARDLGRRPVEVTDD